MCNVHFSFKYYKFVSYSIARKIHSDAQTTENNINAFWKRWPASTVCRCLVLCSRNDRSVVRCSPEKLDWIEIDANAEKKYQFNFTCATCRHNHSQSGARWEMECVYVCLRERSYSQDNSKFKLNGILAIFPFAFVLFWNIFFLYFVLFIFFLVGCVPLFIDPIVSMILRMCAHA